MPRSDSFRLRDIVEAIDKIQSYAARHPDWAEEQGGLVWDAILYNLAVIGEAAKAISDETKSLAPNAEWSPAAKMRDVLIHRYSSTDPLIVAETVDKDLSVLRKAVTELLTEKGDGQVNG